MKALRFIRQNWACAELFYALCIGLVFVNGDNLRPIVMHLKGSYLVRQSFCPGRLLRVFPEPNPYNNHRHFFRLLQYNLFFSSLKCFFQDNKFQNKHILNIRIKKMSRLTKHSGAIGNVKGTFLYFFCLHFH